MNYGNNKKTIDTISRFSALQFAIVFLAFSIVTDRCSANDGNEFRSYRYNRDRTCATADPPSLGWKYRLFGNSSSTNVLKNIQYLQASPDERLLGSKDVKSCLFGICDSKTSSCKCSRNWVGSRCQNCHGRTLWSHTREGLIVSNIANSYADLSRCTWIITPPPDIINASLQLRVLNISTECSWDLLFVFDGTIADPTQLLAVISGDLSNDQLRAFPIIYSKTGSLFIYFYADAYLAFGGFTLEYSYSYCPRNCSGNGVCVGQSVQTSFTMTTFSNGDSPPTVVTTVSPVLNISEASVSPSFPTSFSSSSVEAVCACDDGFGGDACDQIECPNNCSHGNGTCLPDGTCHCSRGFSGADCSQREDGAGYWDVPYVQHDFPNAPGAGSAAVFIPTDGSSTSENDIVWFFGGFDFATRTQHMQIFEFDLVHQSFVPVATNNGVQNRYGHSAVFRSDLNVVYVFGGTYSTSNRITSELVMFNITNRNFSVIEDGLGYTAFLNVKTASLTGHTAHLIDNYRMFIFFGFSPDYGLSDWLRVYDCNANSWKAYQSPYGGRAWHSSVHDETTNSIFIYGGFSPEAKTKRIDITAELIKFDVNKFTWTSVTQLPLRRAFHAAVLLSANATASRSMLVYGGTMHETATSIQSPLQESGHCVVAKPFIFNLDSGCYFQTSLPSTSYYSLSRIGHTSIIYNSSALFFGGFDGRIISDTYVRYVPLDCQFRHSSEECGISNGFSCQWVCNKCYSLEETNIPDCNSSSTTPSSLHADFCPLKMNMTSSITTGSCAGKSSCSSCISYHADNGDSCEWQTGEKCVVSGQSSTTPSSAIALLDDNEVSSTSLQLQRLQSLIREAEQCPASCYWLSDCASCTNQASCLWCNTLALCVPSDSYRIAFPYGQCQDWTMSADKCRTNCSAYHSCENCQKDLRCGWCDDGSGTGTGTCMVGGLHSALNSTLTDDECPANNWYFATCPLCQCSGHSTCYNGTDNCIKCENNTMGEKCETCATGYYGSSLNGETCDRCKCNNHATYCNSESGVCNCDTQGVSGAQCDVCDRAYEGDAVYGTCYYPIQAGYRYTMDLTKKEMQYINKINFQTKDRLGRSEVNFKLNCTKSAAYILSFTTGPMVNSSETIYRTGLCAPDIPQVDITISPTEGIPFSEPYFRFRIAISNFTHPFMIVLVATEQQAFYIYILLIAVFGCFLVVLIIAIIVFQIKRRYDDYHRRQQVKTELRRMAKRPFAMVNFLVTPPSFSGSDSGNSSAMAPEVFAMSSQSSHAQSTSRRMMPSHFPPRAPPMPVTLQPLAGPGAAIMTVLIQLPISSAFPSSQSENSEVSTGSPSTLGAGSVIVRAASNLLSDLSTRNRQQDNLQAVVSSAADGTLCASSAAMYAASMSRTTGIGSDEPVSPVMVASRRSSRQTCWNTPPGSINKPPGWMSREQTAQSAAATGHQDAGINIDLNNQNSDSHTAGLPNDSQVTSF